MGIGDFIAGLALLLLLLIIDRFYMQPYRFHRKSKWWTVAVQLTEVTSYRRVRLCCQFYEHNNYLTSDAVKD